MSRKTNVKQTSFFEVLGEKAPEPPKEKEEKKPVLPAIRYVYVEAQTSNKKYKVDLYTGDCTCSSPPGQECFHLKKARDVHVEKCARTRYEAVSAMHKDIRRGDLETSLYWADVLSRHSDYYVRRYLRKIVGEETRNWNLYWMALKPGDYSYRDMVGAITQSRKKWEHPEVCKFYKQHLMTYSQWRRDDVEAPENPLGDMREAIANGDVEGMYWAFTAVDCQGESEVIQAFSDLTAHEVERRFPEYKASETLFLLDKWQEWTGGENWEIRLTLVEMLTGAWDESMNEFIHDPDGAYEFNSAETIRKFQDYVYDKHVHQGRRRLEKFYDDIRPMQPQPEKIDLRWSGQFLGVAWRYAAYKQFGENYINAKWEDVKWSKEFWDAAQDITKVAESE